VEACSQVFYYVVTCICKCDDNENDLNPYIHFVLQEICDSEQKTFKESRKL